MSSALALGFLAASLASFTPQGSVKKASQVQARFDTDMVEFGNGRAPSPFKVDCPVRGDGRWLDARTYVHDFVKELPGGVRCTFTLVQVKNLQGERMSGEHVFTFDTGGPALIRSIPSAESTYVNEDEPVFLVFDAPIKMETLKGHLSFQVPQRADAIGAEILPDAMKYVEERWSYLAEELKQDPKFFVLVKPKERLPSEKEITLVIDAGVSSTDNVLTRAVQTLSFTTRPGFRASFNCERESKGAPCIPMDSLRLSFNSNVDEKERARIRVFQGKDKKEVEIDREDYGITIPAPHPANASYRIEIPADLKDAQGRTLQNAKEFPMTVKVGEYGPLIKFPGEFGILEASRPVWPLNMRRVEADLHGKLYKVPAKPEDMMQWYKVVQESRYSNKRDESILKAIPVKDLKDVPLKKPNGPDAFEVIGVPLDGPGFYVMEVGSPKLGAALLESKGTMFARAGVLVTNLAVHVKKGRQGALIWVTTLDKGQPVADAEISVIDCKGNRVLTGKTDAKGMFQNPTFPTNDKCYGDSLVSARKDNDLSFAMSGWNEGIESWRFQLPWDYSASDLQIHSILDRSLFRVGETVSMLHVARHRLKDGLAFPKAGEVKNQVVLQHVGSDKNYRLNATWDGKGRAENSWKIPADAPLGWYMVMIADREAARFRVDEFRLATMRGRLQTQAAGLIAPKNIGYDFDVSYLSGGPASGLAVRLRRSIQGPFYPRFPGYDAYDFETGPVEKSESERQPRRDEKVETKDITLDKAGTGTVSWSAPTIDRPTRVLAEMEFPDASGEARTVATEHKIWPAAVVLGMKGSYWLSKDDALKLDGIALDTNGQPVAKQDITVRVFKEEILSHRRRGVGGTYVYDHKTEIKEVGVLCEATSDDKGLWHCEKKIPASGTVILQAEAKDKQGHVSLSRRSLWVAGERLWFASEEHDRIDLIPEKKFYEPGETAKIQVKMPFAEGTALVSTERDGGILNASVQTIDSKNPFINVPITRGHAPNVFVSVWVVRGRVKGTEPFLKVDLGKPSHKLGITEIKVGWKQHTLGVTVRAEKPVYKIRETAKATVEVKSPDGKPLPDDAIATVAVVDEALLELQNNASWDLLSAMMSERSYGIEHATGTMQVIGKRHFGLKALPQGGGGGSNPTRELFDSLIVWKARVPLVQGVATVDIPLQDNLSSFRIVAVAQAGSDLFGTGHTAIQTQQDISLIAGLPPLVREGDHWQALVTLRNRTKAEQKVKVSGRMENTDLPEKVVTVKAEDATLVSWDLDVPVGASELKYTFKALADQGGQDNLKFVQQVKPAIPVRVLQASLIVLNEPQTLPVALPDQADPKRGGLDVSVSPGPGLDLLQGTRVFFQDYPYTCLEQLTSKAVGLNDKNAWDKLVKSLDSYTDADGLLKYFPLMRHGSMTLTAYFLSISNEAGFVLPPAKREALTYALKKAVDGNIQDHEYRVPGDQLVYRKIMALEALTRWESGDALLVKNYDVKPEMLPHATLIDLVNVLSRETKDATLKELKDKAVQQLQARLRLSGTQFGLAGEEYNSISSLLSSPDSNAARLLLLGLNQNLWAADQAKMLEGLLRRQKRGAWSTTTANTWGTLALRNYLKVHPAAGADTKVQVKLADQTQTVGMKEKEPLHLNWPAKRTDLVLSREGQGEVWSTVVSRAAVPLKEPFQAGYQLQKTLTPIEQKVKGKWSRGDIIRVDFAIQAGSDQTWVVLNDPVPAGARILNASLRDESAKDEQSLAPSYVERRHEGYIGYFDFMPNGQHKVSYVMQVNNPGKFQLTSTRLEAMYAPDQYAELPNASFQVD